MAGASDLDGADTAHAALCKASIYQIGACGNVVANENITSAGVVFARWYRRFRSLCKHSDAEG